MAEIKYAMHNYIIIVQSPGLNRCVSTVAVSSLVTATDRQDTVERGGLTCGRGP